MRRAVGSALIGLLCAVVASGTCLAQAFAILPPGAPAPQIHKWVRLNGAADLERLRATNFNHYLRARRILAAGNEICQPGAAVPIATRFGAAVNCQSMLWMTSLPPKKLLTLILDDVSYSALVSINVRGDKFIDGPARAVPAAKSAH